MSFRQVSRSIWQNPGNRGKRLFKIAAAVRWQLHKRTGGGTKTITLPNGVLFRAYPDCVVSSGLIYADWPEYHELQFCRRLLEKGNFVIDIGANVGHVSLLLSDVVGPENLICFEPTPVSCRRLRENFEANGWPTARLYQLAVGRSAGTVPMPDVSSPLTTNSVASENSARKTIDVEVRSLDGFGRELSPGTVGLLKIDVEGYEPEVFEGAKEFLAARRPKLILFESLSGALHPKISQILLSCGYRVFQLDEQGRPVARADAQNLFAAPDAKVCALLDDAAAA